MKTIIRILIILLVMGLAAGGIYQIVVNSGTELLGQGQFEGGRHNFNASADGEMPALPEGGDFVQGERPDGGDFEHGKGGEGFSARGWLELATQAGKVAVITVVVVLIQAFARLVKRRKQTAINSLT